MTENQQGMVHGAAQSPKSSGVPKETGDLTSEQRYYFGRWFIFKASKGRNDHLEHLYKHYPEVVSFVDEEGCNALHGAAAGGHSETCKILLQWMKKADIDLERKSTTSEYTALHYAASSGHLEVVKILLRSGMQADARDDIGRCAHMHAGIQGHVDVVECILDHSRDSHSIDIDEIDTFGNTALQWAIVKGRPGVTQLLLRRGADFYRTGYDCKEAHELAVVHSKVTVARILKEWRDDCHFCHRLAKGEPIETTPKACWKALSTRCKKHGVEDGINCYDILKERDGETLLMTAAKSGNVDVLQNLLYRGANFEAVDQYGRTALYLAASKAARSKDNMKCLRLLILRARLGKPLDSEGDEKINKQIYRSKSGEVECKAEDIYVLPLNMREWYKDIVPLNYRFAPLRMRAEHALNYVEKKSKVGKTALDIAMETIPATQESQDEVRRILREEKETLRAIVKGIDDGRNMSDLQRVYDVLQELDLIRFLPDFVEQGFDSIERLRHIADDDMEEMGWYKKAQYRGIHGVVKRYQTHSSLQKIETVQMLLQANGVNSAKFHEKFQKDGFDTLEKLKHLKEDDLLGYGIPKGNRRAIMVWHDQRFKEEKPRGGEISEKTKISESSSNVSHQSAVMEGSNVTRDGVSTDLNYKVEAHKDDSPDLMNGS